MRKKLLLFVLMLVCVLSASAESVSREEALQKAKTFMQKKGISISEKKDAMVSRAPRRKSKQDASCYYVFNADAGHGFVIVSGDDRTVPVLGYSSSGTFIPDSIPENMRAWLQGYADLIDNLDSLGVKAVDTTTPVANKSKFKLTGSDMGLNIMTKEPVMMKREIMPLLTSKWNQSLPYNIYCPFGTFEDNEGVHYVGCPTGCVATAMAQVMYYHRWPNATIADIPSYTTATLELEMGGVPAGTPINWDGIKDSYTQYSFYPTYTQLMGILEKEGPEISRLMEYCGKAMEMDYTLEGSGAVTANVGDMLKKYFDYDQNIYHADRAEYTIARWDALLYNELIHNRPIVYHGTSTGGGHAFVLDGYDGESLYHVNWGWGGYCDGYFAVSVLNPNSTEGIGASSTPDGYSMNQGAVIGVQPPGMSNPVDSDNKDKQMTTSLRIEDTYFLFSCYNNTSEIRAFDVACNIINIEENAKSFIYEFGTTVELEPGWGYSELGLDVSGLQPGKYKIYPMTRIAGATEWLYDHDPDSYYVLAVVNEDGTVVLELHPTINLTADNFIIPGNPAVGENQVIKATITNNGDEFYGNLYFASYKDGDEAPELFSRTGVAVPENGQVDIDIYFTPEEEADYHIYVVVDKNNDGYVSYDTEVIGETLLTFGNEPVVDLKILSGKLTNDPVVNNAVDFYVTVRNDGDDYNGPLYLFYASEEDVNAGMWWTGLYGNVSIAAGETGNVYFSFTPIEVGRYNLYFATDPDGDNIIEVMYIDVEGEYTDMLGDANGDSKVDVSDLVTISKYIADGNGSGLNVHNADLTGDGRITVADIVELARRIAEE